MTRKKLLIIILVLTFITITIVLIFKTNIRYNKLIINLDKWNSIISNRNQSTSINFESIEFNDYNLLIDNENSIIYYSVVNSNKKYNPSIKYITNKKVKLAISSSITDELLEQTNSIKIMLYDDIEYRIYTLVATNYPILNVIYKDNKTKPTIELELFDNHIDSPQRILKSAGVFRTIEEDNIYSFSLFKQSLGNNKRKNHVSIFGMQKQDEYIIKKTSSLNEEKKYVRLFINNQYKGLYSLVYKEGRINNFERNRENNK